MVMNENWNMLGHSWAVNLLKNNLSSGRIRHAYLFSGPQGIGKRTLALRLAQAINCNETEKTGIPCGGCRSCRLFDRMQHPDLSSVQAESVGGTLKVDQIRGLQHSLSLTPYEARYRVALILRFEEANQNAANALLKTLEEPPAQVVMMLTAQEPEALLPTVVSRCELLRLRPLTIPELALGLQDQIGLSSENANLLAHISGGRPGYALNLNQDPQILKKRETWLEDHQRLLSSDRVVRFSYADTLAKERESLGNILQIWSSFWRDVLLVVSGSTAPITNLDQVKEINKLAMKIDLRRAKGMVEVLDRTRELIHRNVNPRLTLEILLLNLPYS
jgi:DNA polymerase-3 subunit delta'